MDDEQKKKFVLKAIEAAFRGGERILEVYASDFTVEKKEDDSPVTLADKKSHESILHYLAGTRLPVLSEEGDEVTYAERKKWTYYWLVDPLDGTKEFVKRNGEFTVNIALMQQNKPIAGVIYAPVKEQLYFALDDGGAYKATKNQVVFPTTFDQLIANAEKLPLHQKTDELVVIASRSHQSTETQAYIEQLKKKHPDIRFVSAGSALKFCLIAEGKADVYPRFASTMEWDVAAGQIIIEQTGKQVFDYLLNAPMRYNKESLVNNWFVVK